MGALSFVIALLEQLLWRNKPQRKLMLELSEQRRSEHNLNLARTSIAEGPSKPKTSEGKETALFNCFVTSKAL